MPPSSAASRRGSFAFRSAASRARSIKLGPKHELWMKLEVDLGFEHGFAAGRSATERMTPSVGDLAKKLRDTAIRCCPREEALVAMLDAAFALAVGSERSAGARSAKKAPSYAELAAAAASRASLVRDAASAIH